jgi:hypothetical protein
VVELLQRSLAQLPRSGPQPPFNADVTLPHFLSQVEVAARVLWTDGEGRWYSLTDRDRGSRWSAALGQGGCSAR